MQPVTIYTTSVCPYCAAAKDLLHQKGVNYDEISVDGDREGRAAMTQRNPQASFLAFTPGTAASGPTPPTKSSLLLPKSATSSCCSPAASVIPCILQMPRLRCWQRSTP